jgi:hypothetical protein
MQGFVAMQMGQTQVLRLLIHGVPRQTEDAAAGAEQGLHS